MARSKETVPSPSSVMSVSGIVLEADTSWPAMSWRRSSREEIQSVMLRQPSAVAT
jgi:hypothetical protein